MYTNMSMEKQGMTNDRCNVQTFGNGALLFSVFNGQPLVFALKD